MSKIRFWYDMNGVPAYPATKCIKCNKFVGRKLDNQMAKYVITVFVTNVVFRHIGIYWIIKSKEELKFDIEHCRPNWVINGPWYNINFFHISMVHHLKIIVKLHKNTGVI